MILKFTNLFLLRSHNSLVLIIFLTKYWHLSNSLCNDKIFFFPFEYMNYFDFCLFICTVCLYCLFLNFFWGIFCCCFALLFLLYVFFGLFSCWFVFCSRIGLLLEYYIGIGYSYSCPVEKILLLSNNF